MTLCSLKKSMKGATKVFIANLTKEKSERLTSVKLRHPGRDTDALFFTSSTSPKLLEITSHEDKYRSWFVDESAVSDGTLYMATPCDPLYIVLPYLQKGSSDGSRFAPLEQMLVDEEYPDVSKLCTMCSHTQLLNVADAKSKDPVVYKYSEEKTIDWLKKKIGKTGEALRERGVTVAGACVREKAKDMFTQEQREKYACELVCEYLPEKLAKVLKKMYGVEETNKRKQSEGGQEKQSKKAKVEAEDDYSKTNGNAKEANKGKDKPLNTKQKALVKASSGSKSITSFFGKKSK